LEREIIYAEDLEAIFGKRPWISRSQEILESNKNTKTDDSIIRSKPQKVNAVSVTDDDASKASSIKKEDEIKEHELSDDKKEVDIPPNDEN